MKNLQEIFDHINTEILDSHSGLLNKEAQAFIKTHKSFTGNVKVSQSVDLVREFTAAQNTLAHLQSQFVLLQAQQEIYSFEDVANAGYFKRWTELCKRMNEDAEGFTELAREKLL